MYHYTMCGLDNVWLENGYTLREGKYGQEVAVDHADELHLAIAGALTKKKGTLTAKEFRFIRKSIGLSQQRAAEWVGVTEQTLSLWERGQSPVTTAGDRLIRLMWTAKQEPNAPVGDYVERMNTVDRIIHQKIVAREAESRWDSKMEPSDEAEACS